MAALDDLQTASTQIAARIKEITANPKPTYEIDGQRVEWTQYLDILLKAQQKIGAAIARGQPFEHRTQYFTPDNPTW